ncbi:uncharacterized protein UTRI_06502_B [Ustilago trichophora]|uniref:MINDY deubiquitinase domain-containing protein n=1 Tax=Ustilago trichophora TaxID=86804 RepID=A0A5C3ENW2_9BASI|nr:uncharacterized protein UTRI_06502_B [Ustilago trichophora]
MADGGGGGGGGGFFGGGGGFDGGAAAAAAAAASAAAASGHHHHHHHTGNSHYRNHSRRNHCSPANESGPIYQPPSQPPPRTQSSAPMRPNASSSNSPPSNQPGSRVGNRDTSGHEEAQWSLKDIYWQGRECKIITQNQNGPCSLIALCNILLLRGELEITPPDRPVVSYSYLSQLIAEHLLTKATTGGEGEGLEAALSTLPRTQYGLDVDVGFDSITSFAASTGSDGGAGELALFRLCGVQLVHGWLPDPADVETHQAVQAAGSYNKATDIVVRGDEVADGAVVRDRGVGALAARLASESSPSNGKQPEPQAWTDEQRTTVRQALALQSFLDTQSTQLTYHGLFVLAQELPAGQPVALFRNSHLSVLYRRLPHQGVDEDAAPPTLFTLATDSSFLMEDEIVWESLVDVDGASSEFYDGKFHKSTMRQGDYVGRDAGGLDGEGGAGFQQNQDADYALAMQIYQNDQDRLERHQRRRNRRSQSGTQAGSRQGQYPMQSYGLAGTSSQPVFETPKEVFTTMRYEAEASKQDGGDALVVSSLIPARLRGEHEELLGKLQGLSIGQTDASNTAVPAPQSTNPFLSAADNVSVGGLAPAPISTNPFLNTASTTANAPHRLYKHIPLLTQHLERLKTSAGAMCRAYSRVWSMPVLEQERSLDPERILDAIESSLASSTDATAPGQVKGIRVAIGKDGLIRVTHRNITPFPSTLEDGPEIAQLPSVRLDYMPTRVRTMDLEPLVFNKTDARGFYEAAKQRVGADPSVLSGVRDTDRRCFDVILWNDEQMDTLEGPSAASQSTRLVTETSLANVVLELLPPDGGKSRFVTPRTSTGMLDGLLRHWMVSKGIVEEEDVQVDYLMHRVREGSAYIWLCNSLRGVWRVELVDPPHYGDPNATAAAARAGGKPVKKTRFSSLIKNPSRTNSSAGPSASAPAPASASAINNIAAPQQVESRTEAVHQEVADDLYGHKQGDSSKLKGKKKKAKDGKDKDCIIM